MHVSKLNGDGASAVALTKLFCSSAAFVREFTFVIYKVYSNVVINEVYSSEAMSD